MVQLYIITYDVLLNKYLCLSCGVNIYRKHSLKIWHRFKIDSTIVGKNILTAMLFLEASLFEFWNVFKASLLFLKYIVHSIMFWFQNDEHNSIIHSIGILDITWIILILRLLPKWYPPCLMQISLWIGE